MIISIIGSGGREHAICKKISESPQVSKIYCIPGNAGTSEIAENIEIDINNFDEIKNFLIKSKIDLVVVGPEKPLVNGIVDFLEKEKIKVFGPKKIPSQLEGSKIFTKKICKKYNIPTANFGIFENTKDTINFIKSSNFPIVVKSDGLASGKGVYICENSYSANEAVKEIFDGKFGEAKNVLIEEFLKGDEMSFFVICDGKNFQNFQTAQDHKRAFEGDKGKNTGGMGAYSPSALINNDLEKKIIDKIIIPTLKAVEDLGENYKGFLYAGLMIKDNEPYLIEYNVRMGDPECQTILPLLETDFLKILNSCCDETLDKIEIKWKDQKSLCVVVCSKGYPGKFKSNIKIDNLKKLNLDKNDYVFHAGTKKRDNKIVSNGGRVLKVVGFGDDLKSAIDDTYDIVEGINFDGKFYRKDIGQKGLNRD